MSVKNLVQCPLITPVSSTATELLLGAVSAPYSLPPLDGGILVISDSPSKPSFVEFIKYTHRNDNVLYGVSRGQEETVARAWTGVTYVYQALTADQYTSELASKEPVIPPGTAAQYWRGDKTFQDLGTAVRAANLAGLSLATNTSVAATDTILAALGKLQAQVNARLLATANAVSATKLQTARTISVAGDATGSLTFDGTANVSMDVSLQPSGVSAGVFTKVTVDSKGRVTAGTSLVAADIPTLNQNTTGNAGTATKLQTSRTINGVSFDGTANITVADGTKEPAFAAGTTAQYRRGDKTWQDFATAVRASVLTGLSTVTATTALATDTVLVALGKLQAQVSGLGTSKLDATANAVSATKLDTARTIALTGDVTGSATFDGTANASITATVADDSHNHIIGNVDGLQAALDGKLPLAGGTATGTINAPTFNATSTTNGGFQGIDADTALLPSFTWSGDLNTGMWRSGEDSIGFTCGGVNRITINTTGISGNGSQLTALNASNISTGTIAAARVPTLNQSTTGNAATATKLQTARTITLTGGVAGSASFDGSANVSINAQVADDSHTHSLGNLGLGNAAKRAVQTSPTDATAGALMAVGAFGLGAAALPVNTGGDLDAHLTSGFLSFNQPAVGGPGFSYGSLLTQARIPSEATQIAASVTTNQLKWRRRVGSAWSAWLELFHNGNILGTVSHSNGVPTGAIIERGSNANGEYIRWADGTQICTVTATITTFAPTRAGYNWNFPAKFAADPWFVDITPHIGQWWSTGWPFEQIAGTAYEPSNVPVTDGVLLYVISTATIPSGSVGGNKCYAIGRWF